ncbi:hypothetical protein OSTOST_07244 [Ostertagia ostertagi]
MNTFVVTGDLLDFTDYKGPLTSSEGKENQKPYLSTSAFPNPRVLSTPSKTTMMVIPVSQHKLIKIRRINRQKLTRLAFYCSLGACINNGISSSTNNWLYTSEVLKYYVSPNNTQGYDDSQPQRPSVYFKNASLGPWHSENPIQYPSSESIRRAFVIMMIGMVLDVAGLIMAIICNVLPNPYSSLFVSTVIHINAGIVNFLCIIVFMSAVSKEVGNKIHPASEMDDPLFHFEYGFSFILLKSSFLLTELAALFSIVVYMAKRDERTFNRYKIRSLLNFSVRNYARSRSMINENEDVKL